MSKLVIVFPGVGYTCDKPLLYFSRKIAKDLGYEEICVEYGELPKNIKGDIDKMKQALLMAYEHVTKALEDVDYSIYDEVLIIGKSIGSVVATKYHEEHCKEARLVLYTPVEATFKFKINDGVAFIGDSDSWSNLDTVKELAEKAEVPLHIYADCNHSLEVSGDYERNIEILAEVMDLTYKYIKNYD